MNKLLTVAVALAGWFLLASANPHNGGKEKRGIFGDSPSLGDYHNSIHNPLIDQEQHDLEHEYAPMFSHMYGHPITKQVTIHSKIPVPVPVPQPYHITVEKNVPVPVPHPVAVPVERKVPVPVPYTIVKHVAVPVEKPVPVPVPQPYPVTVTIVKHIAVPTGRAAMLDHLRSSNGQHSLNSLHHAISPTGLSGYSSLFYNGGMSSSSYPQQMYLHHSPHHSQLPSPTASGSSYYSPI